jgi:hypothetical protein
MIADDCSGSSPAAAGGMSIPAVVVCFDRRPHAMRERRGMPRLSGDRAAGDGLVVVRHPRMDRVRRGERP